MLIVVSSEGMPNKEVEVLCTLFTNGLRILHLRKPNTTEIAYCKLLESIPVVFHQYIVLHDYHHLVERFTVRGVHLKEGKRQALSQQERLEQEVLKWRQKGLTVSSSFHDTESLKDQASIFDYVFLSPVFDSISKDRYKQKEFHLPSVKTPIVALGGVESKKISKAMAMGYDGVAVLGSVWNSKSCTDSFKEIKQAYEQVAKNR